MLEGDSLAIARFRATNIASILEIHGKAALPAPLSSRRAGVPRTGAGALAGLLPTVNEQQTEKNPLFISLRWKLLAGFTVVFSLVFSASYYWFYTFAMDEVTERLQIELKDAVQGAAAGVDVKGLLTLCTEGQPNKQGFSDHPQYKKQLDWLQVLKNLRPHSWPYIFVLGDTKECQRNGKFLGGDREIFYLVDLEARYNPFQSTKFLDRDTANSWDYTTLKSGIIQQRTTPYTDKWGTWVSAYAPLKTSAGKVVAGIGIDIEADYIWRLQQGIRYRIFVAFAISYGILFVLIYISAGVLSQPLINLTKIAKRIGKGDYNQKLVHFYPWRFKDEIIILTQVFEQMIGKVRDREENLKGKITQLQVEIDEAKRQKQVQEIVETDYFKDIQAKAKRLRERQKPSLKDEDSDGDGKTFHSEKN